MKTFRKCVIVFFFTMCVLGVIAVVLAQQYVDTHVWATVMIAGTRDAETADAYMEERECIKGDQINIGTLTLEVTKVDHKGNLSFKVKNGELKDESGNVIRSDEIGKDVVKSYTSENDHFTLRITSNRHE